MQKILNITRILFIVFITGCLLAACTSEPKKVAEREKYIIPDSLLRTLHVDTVQTCQLVDAITLTGGVDFNQDKQVSVFPLVSGNIQDIKVELGDYVTQGQVLAVVNSVEMAGFSSNLATAQSGLDLAKKSLDAQKSLFASGLASQLDVNSAQAAYDQATAQLQLAQRVLKVNGDNTQGNYVVKAPISGFIVQKNVTNNTAIRTDNGTNLFTISDLKEVWVQANVYESNIGKIHMGDKVDVTTVSYPGRVFTGRIDKLMNVLDPTNKVMKVKVVLPNPDYALKPAMFASVTVTNPENKEAICVSSKALIFDHSQYFVLKYNGGGDVTITPVQVLSSLGDKTYLSGGVNIGDKLIASQAVLIYDAVNN